MMVYPLLTPVSFQNATNPAAKDALKKKEKEEAEPEATPLEKMLMTAGAAREDGSDKFFGMENVCRLRVPCFVTCSEFPWLTTQLIL